uniref:Uncharacterized protein LOC113789041 n=1 Tax=Dermatophagoides pteronyssinus TaxID=6956 RepID=A0A6P6XNH6_DERPT|nr:uncharacterized protein LOC113789041 [Dermatophagoides pteronyssinus]
MRSTVLAFAILTVMVIIMSSSGRFDRKQSSSSMVEAGQKKKMRIAMALIHLLGRRNKMIVPFPIPIPVEKEKKCYHIQKEYVPVYLKDEKKYDSYDYHHQKYGHHDDTYGYDHHNNIDHLSGGSGDFTYK